MKPVPATVKIYFTSILLATDCSTDKTRIFNKPFVETQDFASLSLQFFIRVQSGLIRGLICFYFAVEVATTLST